MNPTAEHSGKSAVLNFDYIYKTYSNKIWVIICSRVEGEQNRQDLLQDVFVKFCKSIEQFENEKAAVKWLKKTAHSTTIDHLRKDSVYRKFVCASLDDDNVPEICDDSVSGNPHEMLETSLLSDTMRDYIDELNDKHREVILLHYGNEELSVNETAARLQLPTQTVYSRLEKARNLLYDKIDEGGLLK